MKQRPSPRLLAAIKAVELDHFRTTDDTGAANQAMTVMNAFRRQARLPSLCLADLPSWDESRKWYCMPVGSSLLTAPAALAKGGRV